MILIINLYNIIYLDKVKYTYINKHYIYIYRQFHGKVTWEENKKFLNKIAELANNTSVNAQYIRYIITFHNILSLG